MIKLLTIVGARPEIIKAAAISRAIKLHFSSQINEFIIHTGQHYDTNMSAIFFEELGIPKPYKNLAIGSASHGEQTAQMMIGIEKLIRELQPDAMLIYGDTNSTVAASLTASKIGLPVFHVEAGLRSFNKAMPEEINRILSDHVSSILFCPTETAVENLKQEGFSMETTTKATINHPHVYLCGDIMYDNSLYFSGLSKEKSTLLTNLGCKENEYVLATIHRDTNTDDPKRLTAILEALIELSSEHKLKIVLPIHPRTQKMMQQLVDPTTYREIENHPYLQIIPPAGFLDMIELERNALLIMTDSGGVQKEAYFFKKACIILRQETEWVEIVKNGNALLADASKDQIKGAFLRLIHTTNFTYPEFFGNGKAAEYIVRKMIENLS